MIEACGREDCERCRTERVFRENTLQILRSWENLTSASDGVALYVGHVERTYLPIAEEVRDGGEDTDPKSSIRPRKYIY